MKRIRAAAVGATVLAGGLVSGGAASADPPTQEAVTLTCDGVTYDVAVAGNGEFTPAHDVDSNTVFIPVAFGEFHGQLFDPEGNLIDEFDETGSTKGQSARNKATVVCSFTFTEVSDGSDPEFPAGSTFVGTGEVTVFTTPRGR